MPSLASDLRRQLENVITDARDKSETAARAALKRLAVDAVTPFDHFDDQQREFRNRLRARARQAGDRRKPSGEQEIDQLTQELAYEYWHRMLFARFLAENHLLMHPDGVSVSLAECDELAKHEGADNGFILAARYASRMLPQIFRTDDVLLEIDFPINDRLPLEKLLATLQTAMFTADDSLGWVYQFWQTEEKKRVNERGEKIDGRALPAVTQLFTEPYMVKFLLHNTIGAWWCAQHGVKGPAGGAGVPKDQVPVEMEYLRWRDDGTPAAGTFDLWPDNLKEFTLMDPCCGSGHFLVEAFNLLVPMRIHDDGLSPQEACAAVLSENLFGLELDLRCTQIAAFALALAAWKYPGESGDPLGYRTLPQLHIACSGQSVTGKQEEWLALANGDDKLKNGMENLFALFVQAPLFGSLIDPSRQTGDLIAAGFSELQPLLHAALAKEKVQQDAEALAVGVAAEGIAIAAELLSCQYTFVATNVPFLTRGKHDDLLMAYCEENHGAAKNDLATVFLDRCQSLLKAGGTSAMVLPQNWLFLTSYRHFRKSLLGNTWHLLARLGEGGFNSPQAAGAFTILLVISNSEPTAEHSLLGIDASTQRTAEEKASALLAEAMRAVNQAMQRGNPDCRITIEEIESGPLLAEVAEVSHGQGTFDSPCFVISFWEVPQIADGWEFQQTSPDGTSAFSGCEKLIRWENGRGMLARLMELKEQQGYSSGKWRAGVGIWGKRGVAVSLMRNLHCGVYCGRSFDDNMAVIVPKDESAFGALWAFCTSEDFTKAIRRIDQKLNVTVSTLVKVPFDIEHWRAVAEDQPQHFVPDSRDPTQWLFNGCVQDSTRPLQVAVARMLGYRWPKQDSEGDGFDTLVDHDGIVCIPAVRGEKPATERLLDVLRTIFRHHWKASLQGSLLTDVGCKPGTTLHEWLRDAFFEHHCSLFANRPFVWHVWDGRKDGFSCLVNYHKLNHKRLETLVYSYLQDWITTQDGAAKSGKAGADIRLVAAQELQNKLKLILAGEPPYDIFVRWKPIHEQPIGWNPDLNDGVRINSRPFVTADVLRKKPNIRWSKDRGKEPGRDQDEYPWFWNDSEYIGDRINDYHLTNAEKKAAREKAEVVK